MDLIGARGLSVILKEINTELQKAFLKFIHDESQMKKVQVALQKLYSPEFIERELLSIFHRWVAVLPNYYPSQKKISKPNVMPLTVPVPFNLNCPKPKAIPIPEPVS
ncbi:hypothetical protein D915_001020 [Fasciola hepatica]|uniref:Uncharacterized protein n=1 Tax=Fasciola hepatica TaxID=6192 RepID=A0A4E0RHF3_FASHE|nr:hypothetical protein D915_001020 [Fasciola hepatica]